MVLLLQRKKLLIHKGLVLYQARLVVANKSGPDGVGLFSGFLCDEALMVLLPHALIENTRGLDALFVPFLELGFI